MDQAGDSALFGALGVLLMALGAALITWAPRVASLRARFARQPEGSVLWRIDLWGTRAVGAVLLGASLAIVLLVLRPIG